MPNARTVNPIKNVLPNVKNLCSYLLHRFFSCVKIRKMISICLNKEKGDQENYDYGFGSRSCRNKNTF